MPCPGKRALKFRDWGKVAATFVDVTNRRAIRVAAKRIIEDAGATDAS
jgi:formylmethanofuran dehydrogenase subunit E